MGDNREDFYDFCEMFQRFRWLSVGTLFHYLSISGVFPFQIWRKNGNFYARKSDVDTYLASSDHVQRKLSIKANIKR